jgi:poly-gamma-glutamate synthesis protein (capsule biosynthesis protein)
VGGRRPKAAVIAAAITAVITVAMIAAVITAAITAGWPSVQRAKVSAVGDLMVHQWQLDDALDSASGEYDFIKSFARVQPYLRSADLTIGNLETVFAGAEAGYSDYPLFNTPDAFALALRGAGFNFLTTANNHCCDKNEAGLTRTLDVLDALGLDHTGTFRTPEERQSIKIKEAHGIRFALLSYTYATNGIQLASGGGSVNTLQRTLVYNDIQKAQKMNPDVIIVLPHMGTEYAAAPDEMTRKWTRFMLEAGADVVLASHPHVLQEMEYVTGIGGDRIGFVDYSLGNFISSQRTLPRDMGVILNLYFEKTGRQKAQLKHVSFIPTWVKFVGAKGAYDIQTLSVYDALLSETDLSRKDRERLKNIHAEITEKYLGRAVPLDQIQNEYFWPQTTKNKPIK